MNGWYINPVGGLGVVIAASAVLLCAMMLVSREMRRMPPKRRWTLVALRVTVFLLIIAAMLRVTRVYTDIRQRPATLVLLVDRSKSMQTADAFGDRPRWDVLKEIIDQSLPLLSNMGDNLEVKVYTFDRDISAVEFANGQLNLGKSPDGTQSAIGAAIDDVTRRESGKRIAGIVLLSDGAQQAYAPRDMQPQTSVRRLSDLPAPLYTVTFGQDRSANQSRDVALTDLIASPSVFIKNDLSVAGTARVNGLVNQPIPVQILFETSPGKMEVVATTTLRAKQNGEQLKFEMNYIPQTPGEKKLVLRAEPQPGERITTNNELSTFVNVLDGGLNVLYLEGAVRAEAGYIGRSLASSPDIKLDFVRVDERERLHWPEKSLSDYLQPGKYNVYIIGDLDSSAFRKEDLQLLSDAVIKRGAGLIMLGGFHSFWPGGYQKTPLADVLPLEARPIDQLSRQDFDGKIREDLHLKTVPLARWSRAGKNRNQDVARSALWIRAADAPWRPPIKTGRFGKSCRRWMGPTNSRRSNPRPGRWRFLPTANRCWWPAKSGAGRVLAFAGDSTWRWFMKGFQREHKRFWRQVILWLAKKDESTDQTVWVKLPQRRFPPATRIDFSAGAHTAEGATIDGAMFAATLVAPMVRNGRFLFRVNPTAARAFCATWSNRAIIRLWFRPPKTARRLANRKRDLWCSSKTWKWKTPRARPELMASLAKMTEANGGEAIAPGATARFAETHQRTAARSRSRHRNQIHPLGPPVLFRAGG